MKEGPDIALVASLIGDPARANILSALMDGCALTASELAEEAGVTPSTTSSHLAKLRGGGLVTERKQGRNRYFSLSDAAVAELVENLMSVANRLGHTRHRPGGKAPALKCSRVCYDHLAGEYGVWMYERLRARRLIVRRGGKLCLTRKGADFVGDFGIDVAALKSRRRALCTACMDWSELSDHLGGAVAAEFLGRLYDLKWATRQPGSRVVRFTRSGEAKFRALLA
ncbi:MAG: winged helix-turn-helix transcriptional regulator [Alphaproteobacteria bacterium]|nr:winged helix-turn-helix transcriptional regulator [Alphaproteobacteria bacterium]